MEDLKHLELPDVQLTGKELGRGSYGYVVGLKVKGLKCAGKYLHDGFFDNVSLKEMSWVKNVFAKECIRHSKLHHPNIVQCLGVHTDPDSKLPMLVMEYMPMSLSSCLEKYSKIPSCLKYRILLGISSGICYLHDQEPSIVHRDLSANNVLLTDSLQAKIADFGVSRIIAADKRVSTLTQTPGTLIYMPPEALNPSPKYDKQLDIFSFGVLVIHVVLQELPGFECGPTKVDDNGKLIAVSEVDRRASLFEKMKDDDVLQSLSKECLNNDPAQRPSLSKIISILEKLVSQCDGDLPFSNTIEASHLLIECQEANDTLVSRAQSIQSQLQAIIEDVKDTKEWSELAISNLARQLRSASNFATLMVNKSLPIGGDCMDRFVMSYKYPSITACYVRLSVLSNADASESSVVVCPPINMTFRGTYVKTIATDLKKAWGVAICKTGEVFVVDHGGYDSLLLYSIRGSKSTVVESTRVFHITPPEPSCWYPSGVAIVNERTVLVADSGNKRIMKVKVPEHPSGKATLLKKTNPDIFKGTPSFTSPVGIGVCKDGSVLVCDRENHRLVLLDSDLVFIREFGSFGNGPDQFHHPWDVAFDSQWNVYVSDCSNHCIKVFTSDLKPLRTVGGPGNTCANLRAPTGICIDSNDFLYVADKNHQRVLVFDPAGNFKLYLGGYGAMNGQFIKPLGVAVDREGFVYVSDGEGRRVQVFK